MDKREQLIEDDDEFTLSSLEMLLILRALDLYAYAMHASGSFYEFAQTQELAKYILSKTPKPELQS